MNEDLRKSILQMCNGAFQERADYAMAAIVENILDPNTTAKAKRKVTITLELCPDDSRQNVVVNCSVTTKLAPADRDTVLEMTPQVPGQLSVDCTEQGEPAELKLIKFA